MLSPRRSLTQHWCPRLEGTEHNYNGLMQKHVKEDGSIGIEDLEARF